MRDHARNTAYDAALRRAIRPGDRVLDIGAGTGLLAMMAARAGAGHVFTCEMNPALALLARDIVRANGLADRVTVIGRHSQQLDAEADLGGRVDVIVSEIVSANVLGQHVLAAHEHAVRHLLRPGGRMIPEAAARVALVEEVARPEQDLRDIEGFDLSLLDRLAGVRRAHRVERGRLMLRSEPAELFAFDLASADECPPAEASVVVRARCRGHL